MILLIIHHVGLTLQNTDEVFTSETFELVLSDWSGRGSDIFLLTSKVLLYWHLIHRLKLSFKGSVYYPSKLILRTLSVFLGLIICIALALCVFFVLYIINRAPMISDSHTATMLLVAGMATLMVSDCFISSLILASFVRGRYGLVFAIKETVVMDEVELGGMMDDAQYADACAQFDAYIEDEEDGAGACNHERSRSDKSRTSTMSSCSIPIVDVAATKSVLKKASHEMSGKQEKLVKTISKSTLLSSIAIASTFLFLAMRICILVLHEKGTVVLVYTLCGSLDATLDLCVVCLNFVFAAKWYERFCWRLDNWCLVKCKKCAARGIYRANKQKYLYGDDSDDFSYRAMA
jgi:hypothetical protein